MSLVQDSMLGAGSERQIACGSRYRLAVDSGGAKSIRATAGPPALATFVCGCAPGPGSMMILSPLAAHSTAWRGAPPFSLAMRLRAKPGRLGPDERAKVERGTVRRSIWQ